MRTMWKDRKTGALYPDEVIQRWGEEGIGDGYGPEPRAFHLTTRKIVVIDQQGEPNEMETYAVSNGELMPVELSDADAAAADKEFRKLRFSKSFALGKGGKREVVGRPAERG